MKKQKPTNQLKLYLLLLGITAGLISCNPLTPAMEIEEDNSNQFQSLKPPLIIDKDLEKLISDGNFTAQMNTTGITKKPTGKMIGKVDGTSIPLNFFGLNEFDTYSVKKKAGGVEGTFYVEVLDPVTGALLEDASGDITCVAFEDDGITARIGGIVTASQTLPSFIGTYAVWIVVDNGNENDDNDQTTDLRIGVPDFIRDFHCAVGFSVDDFGGTFQTTTGNIKVKLIGDDN